MAMTAVALLPFLMAGNVFGQAVQQIELNLFGAVTGYSRDDFEIGFPQSATPLPGRFQMDTGIRGGVRFNVYNSGHWGQEFFYSYEPNAAQFLGEPFPNEDLALDIQVHNLGVNWLYYFRSNEDAFTRPFASFGLGATIYRPTQETRSIVRDPLRAGLPGFDQSNEFAFNYGLGVKQRLHRNFGLRFDVRHTIGRAPSFSLPRESDNPGATVLPVAGAFHNLEGSGGIVFYFGR